MSQKVCTVYGCRSSTSTHPNLSYFTLPTDTERRSTWLQLIAREDLIEKPSRYYLVCERHFEKKCILMNSYRKILKKDSLPTLLLPSNTDPLEDRYELVATSTQTEIKHQATANTQTDFSITDLNPRKRKLSRILSEFNKRLKLYDSENTNDEMFMFNKLCGKLLTKELATLVKAQVTQKFRSKNKYSLEYELFCINLYFTSPQAYILMQKAMCLPNYKTLIEHSVPTTTKINDHVMMTLKAKVDNMTKLEKVCSVIVHSISLKPKLFYNISQDKIIGFHEVDGVQIPIPAKYALVVMVRGIIKNWKQPVGFALLAESESKEIVSIWINKIIENLFEIGLDIKTFVSELGSEVLNAAKNTSVSVKTPYFFINKRKIYYIYDTPHLMKSVRNNLMTNNFHFQSCVGKWEHIVQFYENDKKRSLKLAPKLSEDHVRLLSFDKMKVRHATQVLSNSVATGISAYIDFHVIDHSAIGTVKFITLFNKLFDVLNSSTHNSSNEYKKAFCGSEYQIKLLNKMLNFFKTLILVDSNNESDVTSNIKFIEAFQITIKSILLLHEDLKVEGYNFLFTRRLNQDVLKKFFRQVRSQNSVSTELTCRQFISGFKKIFFASIIKPLKKGNYTDDFMKLLQPKLLEHLQGLSYQSLFESGSVELSVASSDYDQLDMPQKYSLMYIAGFLIIKSAQKDPNCQLLKSYIQSGSNISRSSKHKYYYDDPLENVPIIPPDDFVNFVDEMEEQFRSIFKGNQLNSAIGKCILSKINILTFKPPCPCFPIGYVKKLYVRMKIYYCVKFNNRGACKSSRARRNYFTT